MFITQNTRRSISNIGLTARIMPVPDGVINDNSEGSDLRHIAGLYRSNFIVIKFISVVITTNVVLTNISANSNHPSSPITTKTFVFYISTNKDFTFRPGRYPL